MLTRIDLDASVEWVKSALPQALEVRPTGSVYTNGVGNDLDVLVLLNSEQVQGTLVRLISGGFSLCAATEYGDSVSSCWTSLRYADTNVILVWDMPLYIRWINATELCRWLGDTTKAQRVVIHEMIKNGRSFEEALACVK